MTPELTERQLWESLCRFYELRGYDPVRILVYPITLKNFVGTWIHDSKFVSPQVKGYFLNGDLPNLRYLGIPMIPDASIPWYGYILEGK